MWIRIPSIRLILMIVVDLRQSLLFQYFHSRFGRPLKQCRCLSLSVAQQRPSMKSKHESWLLTLSCCFLLFITISASSSSSPSILRGVHPLDVKYFGSDLIKCKEGSKSFRRDRVNDDFCDCVDGTDEPGTSACASGKFYCRNLGSTPRFLFSSRVNDHICDCCDGSDEYDGAVYCPNTCVMGAGIAYKAEFHHKNSVNAIQAKESKQSGKLDVIQNLKDLWIVLLIQLMVIIYILVSWLFYNRKSRKRRNR